MTSRKNIYADIYGHRITLVVVLCLFGLCVAQSSRVKHRRAKAKDDRVYLIHSDELKFDMYGPNPDAQIVKGRVHFSHQGAQLWCDSAYFYQQSNSVKAFGHVRFRQGDTLSLSCDHAAYDGQQQLMTASKNVVLHHRRQTLYTDSLIYDRLYNFAYFQEGGTLIDGKDKLVSDWGQYNTGTREAVFYYNVKMRNGSRVISTDTLYYDTSKSLAHIVGPSKITSKSTVINTSQGYFNTKSDKAQLFGRSTVVDKDKTITGDSLFYNDKTGIAKGYGNVVYVDKKQKNSLNCEEFLYNEKTGYGFATKRALAKDYSQRDIFFKDSATTEIYTYHINTDSVYRVVHCFRKVRVYRQDVQAVCDSLVFNSKDSCMTMYHDPICWAGERQLLGEVIKAYMNDSTLRYANVKGQALSIEQMDDKKHYNQVSSKEMEAYFIDGKIRKSVAFGNVRAIYYPMDDKDSSLIGLNYTETDTMKMYMTPERKLERIWMPKATGTLYPMTQIPPSKMKLDVFAWFDNIRPVDKDDVFNWRGKGEGSQLKVIKRHSAPLQHLGNPSSPQETPSEPPEKVAKGNSTPQRNKAES